MQPRKDTILSSLSRPLEVVADHDLDFRLDFPTTATDVQVEEVMAGFPRFMASKGLALDQKAFDLVPWNRYRQTPFWKGSIWRNFFFWDGETEVSKVQAKDQIIARSLDRAVRKKLPGLSEFLTGGEQGQDQQPASSDAGGKAAAGRHGVRSSFRQTLQRGLSTALVGLEDLSPLKGLTMLDFFIKRDGQLHLGGGSSSGSPTAAAGGPRRRKVLLAGVEFPMFHDRSKFAQSVGKELCSEHALPGSSTEDDEQGEGEATPTKNKGGVSVPAGAGRQESACGIEKFCDLYLPMGKYGNWVEDISPRAEKRMRSCTKSLHDQGYESFMECEVGGDLN